MGNILIVAIVFIGFSMSMSWVVGHKERSALSDQLEATEVQRQDVQEELAKVGKDLKEESIKIKELTEALQIEKEERAKAEKALLLREAELKAAGKRVEEPATSDDGEAAGLADEEAKEGAARAEQLKREEEARQEAENILLQTELDRVMAEELLLKKAEELAIVKAELALLERLAGRNSRGAAKIRRRVDDGKGSHADRRRIQAEDALEAQLTAKRKREVTLTDEVKEASLVKEEIEFQLEKVGLLKLEREGNISSDELEAALDRAAMIHVKQFSIDGIFGHTPAGDDSDDNVWWRREIVPYRAKFGETLSTIAAKESVYANEELWVVLYMSNLDQTEAPDFMEPGQLLNIPQIIGREEIREKIRSYYSREEQKQGVERNDQAPEESVPLRQSET